MKISFTGLSLPEGKHKFNDPILIELEKKFTPKKFTPYFVELVKDGFEKADAIAIAAGAALDLLILDIEKLENRASRADDPKEKVLLEKCAAWLEDEKPLCDMKFSDDELAIISPLAPLSLKPTLLVESGPDDLDAFIAAIFAKADTGFFYTAGKQEVRAWFIQRGADIVTCAGKIHSDLARGFIRADVVNFEDFKDCFNLQEAKNKGVVETVDKSYIIQDGDIIEIKFSV